MKHGRFRLGLGIAFVLSAAMACAQGISVTINGQPVQFSGTGPQMVNGRVLVPLRGVFEKLGAYVEWHPERHEVAATRGQTSVNLVIGDPHATVNGQGVNLDVPAQIVDGSTMVPIRFVSEAIGAQVGWRESEQLVVITSGDEAPPTQAAAPPQPAPDAGDGPVRMARISLIDGGVTWRPGDDVDWTDAGPNMPLREGAQIWVNPGSSRAEVQFDDGSLLRLGGGANATLHTMYSDGKGEFTEIRLNTGTATLRLTTSYSTYQVDTPLASVTSSGVSNLRIDATNGLRLVVRDGQAQVQGDSGQISVQSGQSLRLANSRSAYTLIYGSNDDDWDRYCDQRDRVELHRSQYLPSSIAIVAGDLDNYGNWIRDAQYGYCWHPRDVDSGWAPYRNGHWIWVSPFGWTWCGNEAWGWAPYHYGTWFVGREGWLWRPGPAQQCWSPAVVHFSTDNGQVAWCPLAPAEVRYPPAVSVGFRIGNWAVNFSIGRAACYTPSNAGYCEPHPWRNVEVNRTTNIYNVTRVTNITNVYVSNNGFVPRNSRVQGGATVASTSEFAGRGRFNPGSSATAAIFTRGRSFAPPTAGGRFAGPTNVVPSASSFSSTSTLTAARPSPSILNRQVVRAPLPPQMTGWTKPMPTAHIIRPPDVAPIQPRMPMQTTPAVVNPVPSRPGRTKPHLRNPVKPNPKIPSPPPTKPAPPVPPVTDPRQRNPRGKDLTPPNRPGFQPRHDNPVVPPPAPPVRTEPNQPPPTPPVRTRPIQPPPAPPVQPNRPASPVRQRVTPPVRGKTPPRKAPHKDNGDSKGGQG